LVKHRNTITFSDSDVGQMEIHTGEALVIELMPLSLSLYLPVALTLKQSVS
jgi:hypothetical protein